MLLASLTLPKFNPKWMKVERAEHTKELLISKCCATLLPEPDPVTILATAPPVPTASINSSKDFFPIEEEPENNCSADKEVMDYLRAGQGIETLKQN